MKCSNCGGRHVGGLVCAPSLPIERTSDWILTEGYVQDDVCKHGIYKLTKPHTIICSICEQVIMPPEQVEQVGDWINDLCRGA